MSTIQHKNIENSKLHEPKDISLAVANKVYVSNGSGSGSWEYAIAHGGTTFLNESTAFTVVAPNAYIKLAPVTTPQTAPIEFTEGTDASLTYVGLKQRVAVISANITVSDPALVGRNATIAIYRNGVILPFTYASGLMNPSSGTYRTNINCQVKTSAVTGDKFEVYIKTGNASNMSLFALQLTALAYL